METQRTMTLVQLIGQTRGCIEELAAWPESETSQEEANTAVKSLRRQFKEDSYPQFFLLLVMCHIISDVFGQTANRKLKPAGLKAAWMKIGDLLGEDKKS